MNKASRHDNDSEQGEEPAPPPYSPYIDGELTAESGTMSGTVQADGRIDVDLGSRIAQTLAKVIDFQQEDIHNPPPDYEYPKPETTPASCDLKLNIVIQVVGSLGDVQPFIALGNALQNHGHRVRIATHECFRDFVLKSGLEVYPIGGDPTDLMAFMVKNSGLIPQMKTLRAGDIQRKREMIGEMLSGCWRSCIDDDPITQKPFVADAIIANPPSFAHVHCAQALSIPVHLMFTMPWSSTRAFPHPLANLSSTSMNPRTANWVSYGVVEWLTWQGLGDVINRWRGSIDLDPIPAIQGPSLAEALKIPFTYCWSPALVAKPVDWPEHIDVCGFFFREPPSYTPPAALDEFLHSGPPPVYIGFGSIVVDNPRRLIDIVLATVARAGVRAIVLPGWSNIIGPSDPNVYYLTDDCPHEWLFHHVAAVVHHGGAGTTACGLLYGRPTAIVPFFGDQLFWGNMIARAGAGPNPIRYASLNPQNLAAAIEFCLTPEAATKANLIAMQIQKESGVFAAVDSFHRHLPVDHMRCSVIPNQPAAWTYKCARRTMRLSKAAVAILLAQSKINIKHLTSYESNPIVIENRRWDPLTGILSAATTTGANMAQSTGEMFYNPYKAYANRGQSSRTTPRSTSAAGRMSTSSKGKTPVNDDSSSISTTGSVTAGSGQNSLVTAENMVGATLQGFGKFTATSFKGAVVDIPHAAAEGFRQVPRLYGDTPKDYGVVQDWKSGAIVGCTNFVDGMKEGFMGFATQPIKGAKEEGALGAVKGFAKGTIGLATKVPSASIGIVAYPFFGISKSLEAMFKSTTRKTIAAARFRDGYYQSRMFENSSPVLQSFDRLRYSIED